MNTKDVEKANELAQKSKAETKDITSEADVKKFLSDKKKEILDTAKKLNGEQQQQFKDIVNALNEFSSGAKNEAKKNNLVSGSKLICGLAATVAFFCSLNTIGLVLASPIYAPLLQFAVKKLTGVKEGEKEELKEAETVQFAVDPKTSQILSKLAAQCKEEQKKMKANQFKVFEYEGQMLSNFWLHLGRVAESLSKGFMNQYIAEDLDGAGTCIFNSNAHKTPGPTDPRDIR